MLNKAIRYYRSYGFAAMVRRISRPLRRGGRNLFYRKSFYVFYRDIGLVAPPEPYNDVEFIEIDRTLVHLIAPQLADHYGNNAEQAIVDRIAAGDIAVAGLGPVTGASRELKFFCWISQRDEILIAFLKRVDCPGSYCIKRLLVPERFRRRSIAKRSHAAINFVASRHGIRRLWSFIDKANTANYRLHTDALKGISLFWGTFEHNSFCGLSYGGVCKSKNAT